MFASLVALAVAASPVKLAALPFERAGIDEGLATLVQDSLVNHLAEKPFLQIVTDRDMAALLGLEREKQLLGCAGDSRSCVAELTGALGVEALVTGSIGRAGRSFQLNVKVIDAAGAKTLFAFSSEPVANEEALLGLCASLAESIAARFEARAPGASSAAPWVLVGVGAGWRWAVPCSRCWRRATSTRCGAWRRSRRGLPRACATRGRCSRA